MQAVQVDHLRHVAAKYRHSRRNRFGYKVRDSAPHQRLPKGRGLRSNCLRKFELTPVGNYSRALYEGTQRRALGSNNDRERYIPGK